MPNTDYTAKLEQIICAVDQLKLSVERLETAFPRDDLGKPGFDRHRQEHAEKIRKSEDMRGYQMVVTQRIMTLGFTLIAAALAVGFRQQLIEFLKG